MDVISCTQVSKSYANQHALNQLTFSIKEDTITGLIGRNGAGKTTLLKTLAGYIHATMGDVQVFSKNPFNSLLVSANLVYVDDQMSFQSSLTLKELLHQGEVFYENWDMDFAMRLFKYFSFHPDDIHENLSKGKKSTFNMIFGVASRCPLTIFDEPTTGMDAAVRKDFYRVLLRDYIAYPRTIIISSHYLDEIENLLENVLLLEQGKKILHMPVDELKEYAIEVSGNRAHVTQWANGLEIITETGIEEDSMTIVVQNNLKKEKRIQGEKLGFELKPVAPSNLCLYLTDKARGGIDDVLNYR